MIYYLLTTQMYMLRADLRNPGIVVLRNPGIFVLRNPGIVVLRNPGIVVLRNPGIVVLRNPGIVVLRNPGMRKLRICTTNHGLAAQSSCAKHRSGQLLTEF